MGAVVVAGGGTLSQEAVRPWLTVNGHDWSQMKPDVRLAPAQAEMTAIAARLTQQYPQSNAGRSVALTRLQDDLVGNVQSTYDGVKKNVQLTISHGCRPSCAAEGLVVNVTYPFQLTPAGN